MFSQNPLRTFLTESGFQPEGILRTWGDRKWLERGQDRGATSLTKAARVNGKVTRCYVIPMDSFVAAGAADADEVDWRMGRLDES